MTFINHDKAAIFFILLFFALPVSVWAVQEHDCVTSYGNGSVNWSTGVIQATGKTSPSENPLNESPDTTLARATLDARRNLIQILMKIAFDKGDREIFKPGDTVMAGIEKRAMDATLSHQHYTSDRAMEVTIETNMFGGFLQLVLPEEIREIVDLKIIPPRKKPNKKTWNEPYTGLIIDARGTDFQPILTPAVVSEQGDEIYTSRFISREYAVQAGVCQFSCTLDPIKNNQRVGPNPLVIRALRRGGKTNQTIVISRSDAATIEKTAERHRFLRQCRVVIIIDQ